MSDPMRFRALLENETAHLSDHEREAVEACLALARQMARAVDATTRERWHICVEAIQLKLLTIGFGLPHWVRALVAKAALEAPDDGDDANPCALFMAAERACARLAA